MSGTVLDKILAHKAIEVRARKAVISTTALVERAANAAPVRGFTQALLNTAEQGQPAIIAEIKRASPSKGLIREDFDPPAHAQSYAQAGASCLSVLTDEQFFQGHDDFLVAARAAVTIPVLRKDFVLDEYQILEARALGADCVLLIVAALERELLVSLYQTAQKIGIDVLLEVHNLEELHIALELGSALIGINNRNLKTFETSIDNTLQLLPHIPDEVMVVTESGISDAATVRALREQGVSGFLVGEAFMRAPDPGTALRDLFY